MAACAGEGRSALIRSSIPGVILQTNSLSTGTSTPGVTRCLLNYATTAAAVADKETLRILKRVPNTRQARLYIILDLKWAAAS